MTKAVFNLFMKGLNQITELMEKEDMTENTEKQKLNECNQKHELRMKKYRKRVLERERMNASTIKMLEKNLATAIEKLEEITIKWARLKNLWAPGSEHYQIMEKIERE